MPGVDTIACIPLHKKKVEVVEDECVLKLHSSSRSHTASLSLTHSLPQPSSSDLLVVEYVDDV